MAQSSPEHGAEKLAQDRGSVLAMIIGAMKDVKRDQNADASAASIALGERANKLLIDLQNVKVLDVSKYKEVHNHE